jgi:predicted nucleotidyltransferase
MERRVQDILEALGSKLRTRYGGRLARLIVYGSHARGDADPQSDIDVLVVLRGEVAPGLEISGTSQDVAEVSLAHNALVVCVFVSEAAYENERSPLLLNVRREGVPA